jgi:hypothetical protein
MEKEPTVQITISPAGVTGIDLLADEPAQARMAYWFLNHITQAIRKLDKTVAGMNLQRQLAAEVELDEDTAGERMAPKLLSSADDRMYAIFVSRQEGVVHIAEPSDEGSSPEAIAERFRFLKAISPVLTRLHDDVIATGRALDAAAVERV